MVLYVVNKQIQMHIEGCQQHLTWLQLWHAWSLWTINWAYKNIQDFSVL